MSGAVDHWFLGDEAVPRIVPLAARFRELLLADVNHELDEAFRVYVPWMATRSRRRQLRRTFSTELPVSPPALLTDTVTLDLLAGGFADSPSHALGAIVPRDIGARLDVDFDGRGGRFGAALEGAKGLLKAECPWIHQILTQLISYVVPIIHRPGGVPVKRGFSTPLCYGAVFLTFEDRGALPEQDAVELAVDLAHEVGHHVLHTYQTADPILSSDLRAPVYSGIKQTERPAIMSIHASVALMFMIAATGQLAETDRVGGPAREYAAGRRSAFIKQQQMALDAIRNRVTPTTLGQHLIAEMEEQIRESLPLHHGVGS